MIDRALALAGVAIGIITLAFPILYPRLGKIAAQVIFWTGVALLLASVLLLSVPGGDGGGKNNQARRQGVLCTGEIPGHCPGPHDFFIGCPNRSPEELLQTICGSHGPEDKLDTLQTGIGGNQCGYALYKVTLQ